MKAFQAIHVVQSHIQLNALNVPHHYSNYFDLKKTVLQQIHTDRRQRKHDDDCVIRLLQKSKPDSSMMVIVKRLDIDITNRCKFDKGVVFCCLRGYAIFTSCRILLYQLTRHHDISQLKMAENLK